MKEHGICNSLNQSSVSWRTCSLRPDLAEILLEVLAATKRPSPSPAARKVKLRYNQPCVY